MGGDLLNSHISAGEIRCVACNRLLAVNRLGKLEINGMPVTGPGAKLNVRICNNGEVRRMLKIWREVEPYKEFAIKSPKAALEELRLGKGTHNAEMDSVNVVIKRVYLAYWMEAGPNRQDYVTPVYVFEGDSLNTNCEMTSDFVGWVNAI